MSNNIEDAIKTVRKKFGESSVFVMSDKRGESIPSLSTGNVLLDDAIGVGGYPCGRIVEIFGAEGSGKSSLALIGVSQAQQHGGVAAYIDAEHALDPMYAKALGVDIDNLLISQPTTAEEALQLYDFYLKEDLVNIVVLDSVAALVPQAELEGDVGDSYVAVVARMMSQALRKIKGSVNKTKTVALFINQTRTRIGGYGFGDDQVTPGGKALKFYSSLRLKISRIGYEKDGDTIIGSKMRIQIIKNKVAPPYRAVETTLFFDRGFDIVYDFLDKWVAAGVVKKSGTWYSYKDTKLGQGKRGVSNFLRSNDSTLNSIMEDYRGLCRK